MKMKVALYMRYSSDKQTEQSIEGQERVCTAYCNANDMQIVARYIDRAVSASKHTEKREEFLRMIQDSNHHLFDAVVVYKLDRFARNRTDSAIYKARLKKNGVRVISATENINDSPESIILESVLEGMAEFYSAELSQKVTRGMHETALKGNSCGGQIPLGYKIENKKFVVDPLTAPLVQEAFTRYANGESVVDICKDFNNRGCRTNRGAKFNQSTFRNVFRNERYIGVYTYKDIRIAGGIPAIIDNEVFQRVQQRREKNAISPASGKAKVEYLLSQKLFCGHCKSIMTGECGANKAGKRYYYYTCSKRKRYHECDKKPVEKVKIEKFIAEEAINLLTPERIAQIAEIAEKKAAEEAQQNSLIPAIMVEIDEIGKSIRNLVRLVERGAESEEIFDRIKELQAQKKAAEAHLQDEQKNTLTIKKETIINWLNTFLDGDPDDERYRKRILDLLINSVTIWDEPDGFKLDIIFNLAPNEPHTYSVFDFNGDWCTKKRIPERVCVFCCHSSKSGM